MGTQEQPCYTLIQGPTDTEQPSEMQLKQDLGKTCVSLLHHFLFVTYFIYLFDCAVLVMKLALSVKNTPMKYYVEETR